MSPVLAIVFLAGQVILTVSATRMMTPCPKYFHYVRDETTNDIMGHVEIPSPPKNSSLHLKVSLSIGTALPSRYVGRLELERSREESVQAVLRGRSLTYRIRFPLRRPIPLLTGIWFNDQEFCTGPKAMGPVVTSIVLEHTLYPPGFIKLSQNSDDNPTPSRHDPNEFPSDAEVAVTPFQLPQSIPEETTKPPVLSHEAAGKNHDCGRNQADSLNLLIARGQRTFPGQWPWLTAIFLVKIAFEFQCAGTLVSTKHVITAAHCLKLSGGLDVPASTLLVALGRYRLRDWRESGSLNREVAGYKFHPEYKNHKSADADIAILELRESVEFSPMIQPICLWNGSAKLQTIVGKRGYVVGWGRDEFGNPYLAEPRMTKVPIVSQEDCLWSNADFVAFTSNRTFCAGSKDGSGPCNGDSGSGLVIIDPSTGRYHLRGIVSRSLLDKVTESCDLTQYVVYVDVAKYLNWINQQIGD